MVSLESKFPTIEVHVETFHTEHQGQGLLVNLRVIPLTWAQRTGCKRDRLFGPIGIDLR